MVTTSSRVFLFVAVFISLFLCGVSAGAEQRLNAQFVNINIKDTYQTCEVFNVRISLKNTGTATWNWRKESGHVTLVSKFPDFNETWGTYFILLGQRQRVAPGEIAVFESKLRAPDTPGKYRFVWQCHEWIPVQGKVPDLGKRKFFGDLVVKMDIAVKQGKKAPASQIKFRNGFLRPDDIQYLGSFKLPKFSKHESAYSDAGICLKKEKGENHLLVETATKGSHLYEIRIPDLIKIDGDDTSRLKRAKQVHYWGELSFGRFGKEKIDSSGGIWFDGKTNILYWGHLNQYFTGKPDQFPQLLATRLKPDGTLENIRYWYIPNNTKLFKGYWGGVTGIPAEFALKYTQGRDIAMGFGGYYSICATASRGPALAAVRGIDKAGPNKQVDILPLLFYSDDHPAPRDGNYFAANVKYWNADPPTMEKGWWTGLDLARSGLFVDLPRKKAYLAFTTQGIGRRGYDYGGYNTDGRYQNVWYYYSLGSLGDAALGKKQAEGLEPYYFETVTYPTNEGVITGSCFDADTRIIYLYQKLRYKKGPREPLIHAYKVL